MQFTEPATGLRTTHHLHFRIGYIYNSKIDLHKATTIYRNRSVFSVNGVIKASLTMRPLILRYNKYDEVSFSPADEEGFISELLRLNPNIGIVS